MVGRFWMRSSCRAARLLAVPFVAVLVASVMLAAAPLHAASYSWAFASGDWSIASNWGGTLPTNNDAAYIANGGTATITLPGDVCSTLSLGGSTGSGTVQMTGGSLSTSYDLHVGDAGLGTFAQSGGTNSMKGNLYLGYNAGAIGTYVLSNSSALITGLGGDLYNGAVIVGYSGSGSFFQTGGTNTIHIYSESGQTPAGFVLGYYASSSGSYNLSGNGQLYASGNAYSAYEFVGYYGNGVFTQSGGTNVVSDYNGGVVEIGYLSGSTGSYILSGSGQLIATTNNNESGANEVVAYRGTATFTQSGGTNTISGGRSDELDVGYQSGSSGTYALSGSGVLTAATEYAGYSGSGTFTQTGGTNNAGALGIAYGPGSSGTYNFNGGLLTLSSLSKGSGTAAFNFGGGTLQTTAATSISLPMTLTGSGGNASVNTAGYTVSLAGPLSGAGGLAKIGIGTLTLVTSNTYSGNTLISGGSLVLGSPLALQNSTLDTSGSGFLSFGSLTAATFGGLTGPGTLSLANSSSGVALSVGNNNASTTFSGTLQGSGTFNKIGSGTLNLTGTNTYTGATTINQGKLVIDGCLTNSAVSVSGGTLSGTGNLTSVTVYSGGHVAPGDPLGVLNLSGNLTLVAGAAMDYELDGFSTDDEISMPSGLLTLSGQRFSDFNFTWTGGFGPGTYTLVNAQSITGLGSNTSGSIDGLPATLSVSNGELLLTVVPEPSTLALLGAGVVGLIGWAWRKRIT